MRKVVEGGWKWYLKFEVDPPSLGTHFPCPHSVCCIVDSSDGTGTASVRGLGPFWKYSPDPIPSDIIWASVRVEEQIFAA